MIITTVLYHFSTTIYHAVFVVWGIDAYPLPFIDAAGTLAARDCAQLGFDVVIVNPCDIMGRVHNYSPLWLIAPSLPPFQSDRVVVGWSFAVAFFGSLSLLPPARSRAELALRIVAAISTMVAFAIERANVDVVLFVFTLVVAVCMSRSRILRLVGYLLAFLAAALKYYPATLLVLALRERLRPFLAVAAAIGALGTLFLLAYGHDVLRTLPHIPAGTPFGDMFGAKNVVFGIYVILRALTVPAGVSVPASLGAGACVVAVAVKLAVCLWRQTEWCTALSRLDPERRWLLLAGALVLSGCFIAEQNVGYRGIFFLLALPGLWDLARDWSVRGWIPYNAAIVVVVLMWERAPRYWIEMMNDKVDLSARVLLIVSAWILREIAYWTIMTLFVVLVLAYVAQSPAVTDFRLWLRRLVCTR